MSQMQDETYVAIPIVGDSFAKYLSLYRFQSRWPCVRLICQLFTTFALLPTISTMSGGSVDRAIALNHFQNAQRQNKFKINLKSI